MANLKIFIFFFLTVLLARLLDGDSCFSGRISVSVNQPYWKIKKDVAEVFQESKNQAQLFFGVVFQES